MTKPSPSPLPPSPKSAKDSAARKPISGRPVRISQRGLLSLLSMYISLFTFSIAFAGVTKLAFDVFGQGLVAAAKGAWAKIIVLALVYIFGWVIATLGVRVFGNLILPIIIKIFAWGMVSWVSILYILIINRLYAQTYDAFHYWAYLFMLIAGLLALLGFHLVLDGHDLRPFAIPLLIIAMFQLFFILFRYVFTDDARPELLLNDIGLFAMMITISGLMVAHTGILTPIRGFLHRFFDRNSHVIRPEN